MKILMTFGATREPIDGVRFITNFSTGKTGAALADEFWKAGHEVLCLVGEGALRPECNTESVSFTDFVDLNGKFASLLSSRPWDAVVHLAAVSDYSVAEITSASGQVLERGAGKLSSSDDLVVRLKRNFKIVGRLKGYASAGRQQPPQVVAFKLTNTRETVEREKAVARLFADTSESVDLVVHNDLFEIRAQAHRFTLYRGSQALAVSESAPALAKELLRALV